jgi:hypothetical protein
MIEKLDDAGWMRPADRLQLGKIFPPTATGEG